MYVLYKILRGLIVRVYIVIWNVPFFVKVKEKQEQFIDHVSSIDMCVYIATTHQPAYVKCFLSSSYYSLRHFIFLFLFFFFSSAGIDAVADVCSSSSSSQIDKIYRSRIGNSFSKFDVPDSLDIDGPSAIYIIEYTHARETRLFLTRISLLSFSDGKMGTILIRRVYMCYVRTSFYICPNPS